MPGMAGAGRWPSPPKSRTPSLQELPTLSRTSTMEAIPVPAEAEQDKNELRGKSTHLSAAEEDLTGLSPKAIRLVKPLLSAATDGWEMDTLSLAELTGNKPLSTLALHLFQHHG